MMSATLMGISKSIDASIGKERSDSLLIEPHSKLSPGLSVVDRIGGHGPP